jgi:hypothetical protein
VVVQVLRQVVAEPVAAVKERWQLIVLLDGELSSYPIRALLPGLRSTVEFAVLSPAGSGRGARVSPEFAVPLPSAPP